MYKCSRQTPASLREPLPKPSPSDRDIISSGVERIVCGDEATDAVGSGFEYYAQTTRRTASLVEMERVEPWPALCGLIERFYRKPGDDRRPVGGRAVVAHRFPAALVQPVRPDSGSGSLRFPGDAVFCQHRPRLQTGAGRDYSVQFPRPA